MAAVRERAKTLAEGRRLLMHADGSYETAYYSGYFSYPPDWGSVAESFAETVEVHSVVLDLTTVAGADDAQIDAYVWDDNDGQPGQVIAMVTGVWVAPIPVWPDVVRRAIQLEEPVCPSGRWWAGYWGNWLPMYYIAADVDGPGGGAPMLKIRPGIEYPSGWQSVDVVWGPTAALGIGAEVEDSPPTPAEAYTWGSVKGLFR